MEAPDQNLMDLGGPEICSFLSYDLEERAVCVLVGEIDALILLFILLIL